MSWSVRILDGALQLTSILRSNFGCDLIGDEGSSRDACRQGASAVLSRQARCRLPRSSRSQLADERGGRRQKPRRNRDFPLKTWYWK